MDVTIYVSTVSAGFQEEKPLKEDEAFFGRPLKST